MTMGQIAQFPNSLPLPAVARVASLMINRHSPGEIAAAIDILMDLLDFVGGDPDTESNGDELDGSGAEEEDTPPSDYGDFQPGCSLSDPAEEDDDAGQTTEDEISYGTAHFGWGGPTRIGAKGPGCPISDPGGCEHDGREAEDGY